MTVHKDHIGDAFEDLFNICYTKPLQKTSYAPTLSPQTVPTTAPGSKATPDLGKHDPNKYSFSKLQVGENSIDPGAHVINLTNQNRGALVRVLPSGGIVCLMPEEGRTPVLTTLEDGQWRLSNKYFNVMDTHKLGASYKMHDSFFNVAREVLARFYGVELPK